MTPLIDMTPDTWIDWLIAFPGADEDTKLAALRNYIEQAAVDAHTDDPHQITAEWLNKKFPTVGISARIDAPNTYVLKVGVNVDPISLTVHASNQAEAARLFLDKLNNSRHTVAVEAASDPQFVSGPPDFVPGQLPDDAPTTVDATLVKLREVVLLAVIAGPKVCVHGANEFLASFGLGTVPERKTFTVSRPVQGVAFTNIDAYDALSAQRVAEWRWENGLTGYDARREDLVDAGDFVVTEK